MKQKFYTLKQLSQMYSVSVQTLKRRLEFIRDELNTIGFDEDTDEAIILPYNKILYSPKQVKIIVEYLGEPDGYTDDNEEKRKK